MIIYTPNILKFHSYNFVIHAVLKSYADIEGDYGLMLVPILLIEICFVGCFVLGVKNVKY